MASNDFNTFARVVFPTGSEPFTFGSKAFVWLPPGSAVFTSSAHDLGAGAGAGAGAGVGAGGVVAGSSATALSTLGVSCIKDCSSCGLCIEVCTSSFGCGVEMRFVGGMGRIGT